jgi:hypothetical protein
MPGEIVAWYDELRARKAGLDQNPSADLPIRCPR